ncbi:hypothetical protein M2480_001885 [Parabacteroides sp. PFB2-12]|uniref:RagB/SusD family nutrient uptake outer membrane protein n=1 Tax=unclassified Parabacteroides TaxID=2649774 RepID=UPI00247582E4|nr:MULTISPECIES: RagB/SusD family nutrient uptake outer membrane protein [unclassified Parabacteroides]MDH6343502.1 hypothetical protein [Parabacteroides sp. PM6-13]MDH6390898.1 hypothetical protein [Parabacteroides sp. PFB2-12]
MKKNIYLLIGLFATALFTGCDDNGFLEEKPKTIYTVDNAFAKSSQVDATIVRAYVAFTDLYGVANSFMESSRGAANLLHGNGADYFGGNGYPYMASGLFSNFMNLNSDNAAFNGLWNSLYQLAAHANLALYGAELVNWESESDKAYAVAQAKFFRGWAYLRLAECFGGVPIVSEYSDELKFDYGRSTREETYKFAIEDLKVAVAGLPNYPEQDGRIAKGIANHYLAEAYIALGTETGDKSQFGLAVQAAEATIALHPLMKERFGVRANPADQGKSNGVANYKEDGNVFYDLFQLGNYDYSIGNTESLMAVQVPEVEKYDENGGRFYMFGITCYTPFRDLNWAAPYQEDGTSGGPWKGNVDYSQYPGGPNSPYLGGTTWGMVGSADYIDDVVWEGDFANDIRNAEVNLCNPIVLDTKHSRHGQVVQKEWLEFPSTHMRISCKVTMQDGWGWTARHTHANGPYAVMWGRDWYVARSSETYLLLAEAHLRNGNQSGATTAINEVRKRAKAGFEYTSVSLKDILDERARELAWEEHRWPTLLRMNTANGPCAEVAYQLEKHTMYASDCGQPGIKPAWGLFPIPLTVINLNSDLELAQNPGW